MTRLEGGCACGAVRYALTAEPLIVHACHCTDCQRLTGGPFVINAWIEKTEVGLLSGSLAWFKFKAEERDITGGKSNQHHSFLPPMRHLCLDRIYAGLLVRSRRHPG